MDIDKRREQEREEEYQARSKRVQALAESMPGNVGEDIVALSLKNAIQDGYIMWDAANLAASYIHNELQRATAIVEWALSNQSEYINCDPDEADQGRKDLDRLAGVMAKYSTGAES